MHRVISLRGPLLCQEVGSIGLLSAHTWVWISVAGIQKEVDSINVQSLRLDSLKEATVLFTIAP